MRTDTKIRCQDCLINQRLWTFDPTKKDSEGCNCLFTEAKRKAPSFHHQSLIVEYREKKDLDYTDIVASLEKEVIRDEQKKKGM